MNYADLHIHSFHSDGTLSPAEIVRTARSNGVKLISVCDHNVVEGTLEALSLARAAGLACLGGVEIDAIHSGSDIHVLCYGANLANESLLARIRRARALLDEMSTELLARMCARDARLSREEYDAFPHDPRRGGWKMLQYLHAKGVTPNLKAGFPLYERYGVGYDSAGFDSLEDTVRAIHAAGGRAVLAHPGVVFPTDSLSRFERLVEGALDAGLDGMECYYPRHSPGVVRRCLEICERRGGMITAGSDCHGAFSHNEIGQTRTPVEKLRLNGLIPQPPDCD